MPEGNGENDIKENYIKNSTQKPWYEKAKFIIGIIIGTAGVVSTFFLTVYYVPAKNKVEEKNEKISLMKDNIKELEVKLAGFENSCEKKIKEISEKYLENFKDRENIIKDENKREQEKTKAFHLGANDSAKNEIIRMNTEIESLKRKINKQSLIEKMIKQINDIRLENKNLLERYDKYNIKIKEYNEIVSKITGRCLTTMDLWQFCLNEPSCYYKNLEGNAKNCEWLNAAKLEIELLSGEKERIKKQIESNDRNILSLQNIKLD